MFLPQLRDEVLASSAGTLGLDRIQRALAEGWLQVAAPARPLRLARTVADALDRGEAEALLLAEEIRADLLITDDAPAREEAVRRGLGVVGTIGVLTQARDQGLVSAALPFLLELRRLCQWISEALLETIREEGKERPT